MSAAVKGARGCVRCICWCCCLLFVLIGIVACLAYYLYTTHKPTTPTYDIKSFVVKSLDVQDDFSLQTEFVVKVKTKNPNKDIGFVYEADNKVSVLYNDAIISSGKFPAFRQDPGNTTVLKITLSGISQDESGSLQDDTKNKRNEGGEIPLVIRVEVPIKIFVGKIDAIEAITVSVSCDLIVDNLEHGKTAKIVENKCELDDLRYW